MGPGDAAGVDVGPLIDAKALAEVSSQLERAVEEGAEVAAQGSSVGGASGYFLEPTLLVNVDRPR